MISQRFGLSGLGHLLVTLAVAVSTLMLAVAAVPPAAQAATAAAAVDVDIALRSPATGVVALDQQAVFDVTITNSGDEALTSLPLRVEFDFSCLQYNSATPAADILDPNNQRAIWDNLVAGSSLAPGADLTVALTLVGIQECGQRTVTTTVEGAGSGTSTAPTAGDNASVTLVSGLSVVKGVLSPGPSVTVGDQVTFQISIRNDSAQEFRNLSLTDTYAPAFLEFVSADPSPATSSTGTQQWTGNLPNLQPGGATTVSVVFRALAATQNTVNQVAVDAEDKGGGAVETAVDSEGVSIVAETPTPTATPSPTPTGTLTPTETPTPTPTTEVQLGSLQVIKSVDWAGFSVDSSQSFEICITGPSYPSPNCQTVGASGGTLTWNNLIPGTYTVSESNPGNIWTVQVTSSPVTVTSGGSAQANVANVAIPEPTTVLLLGTGLAALSAAVARRRRQQKP